MKRTIGWNFFTVAIMAVCLLRWAGGAQAREPRARTLDYSVERKEWIERPTPTPGTPAGDVHQIRAELRSLNFRSAASGCKKFEDRYGQDDPLYPDVMILRASALVGRRRYNDAAVLLKDFIDRFRGHAAIDDALQLRFAIAEAYLAGAKRRLVGLPLLSGVEEGYQILDEISVDFPDSALAESAIKAKADHLFQTGDHALAAMDYARLMRQHPQGRLRQYALRRAADSALAGFAGVEFDEAALVEAQEHYREYRLRYPSASDRSEVEVTLDGIAERRAEKTLNIAAYYERTEHLGSAVFYYENVVQDWPSSAAAVRAASRLELLGVGGAPSSNPHGEDRRGW